MENGAAWLGLTQDDEFAWRMTVEAGVTSGANALFGGGATAAALIAAREAAPQPLRWASAHFGALARAGSEVELATTVISSGRTMTHLEVRGVAEGRESFVVRVASGERPAHEVQGQWVTPPAVPRVDASPSFDHPVHEGTWAARFEWRIAGAVNDGVDRWAAWWVRPRVEDPCEPIVAVAVLADYVTYGVGRALGKPMGGLSIDNVLRLQDTAEVAPPDWLLLEVRPESVEGGFGHGAARLFTSDGRLLATGAQSMVVNNWDWRLPGER